MRLLRLQLENFRSHSALDLDLASIDCAAVVGVNGAGKSSLLLAIEYALYGGSHDELLSRGADKGGVTLTLEQAGQPWRINRGRERGKKSWCVVERHDGDAYKPVAMRTLAESQTYLEAAITGMDQDAFRASVYAPQGEVGVLASLGPGQRKALLGGLLGLDQYEGWREKAALEGRVAHAEAEGARERLAELDERLNEAKLRFRDTEGLSEARRANSALLEKTEGQLGAAIEREKATEQVHQRVRIVAQMKSVKDRAKQVKERADRRQGIAEEIAKAEPEAAKLLALQAQKDAARDAELRVEAAGEAVKAACMSLVRGENAATEAQRQTKGEEAKLAELSEPGASCTLCGQEIAGEHREKAIANVEAMLKLAREAQARADAEVDELRQAVDAAKLNLPPPPAPGEMYDADAYNRAQVATSTLQRLKGELAGLHDDESIEDLQQQWKTLGAEANELPKEVPEGETPDQVRERASALRTLLENTDANIREDEAARETAAGLEAKRGELETEAAEAEVDERAYAALAKAFSRDGIPAMILDNAVGGIEAATNETLEQLGVEMSVRLVTQRATKTGGLTETLDILVDDGTTEAPLESFSGGEQARCHIALRLGLAAVLSASTGLELGFLLIDEVPDVDAAGIELLAELLTKLPQQVILVSHTEDLIAAMPERIVIERSAGSPSAVAVQ